MRMPVELYRTSISARGLWAYLMDLSGCAPLEDLLAIVEEPDAVVLPILRELRDAGVIAFQVEPGALWVRTLV